VIEISVQAGTTSASRQNVNEMRKRRRKKKYGKNMKKNMKKNMRVFSS